jgi:hypothetical protein
MDLPTLTPLHQKWRPGTYWDTQKRGSLQAFGYLCMTADFRNCTAPVYRDSEDSLHYEPVEGLGPRSGAHVWGIREYWHDEFMEPLRRPDGAFRNSGFQLMAPCFSPGYGRAFTDDFGNRLEHAHEFKKHFSLYRWTGESRFYDAWMDTDGDPH